MSDDERVSRILLRAQHARAAEPFCGFERGFYVGNCNVEDRVADVIAASAHPAADTGAVVGRVLVDEPVVAGLRHGVRDRRVRVELPVEQAAVERAELLRLLADDLEVNDRLSHA